MRKFSLALLLTVLGFVTAFAQAPVELFTARSRFAPEYSKAVTRYQPLALNTANLSSLFREAPATWTMRVPFEGQYMDVQLEKTTVVTDNFSVLEALPDGSRRPVAYNPGVFYRGHINGDNKTFAAVSVFENQLIGILADAQSNLVLGAIEQNGFGTNDYMLYRESDLAIRNPTNCFTTDEFTTGVAPREHTEVVASPNAVGEPVEIYIECDYKLYQDKGSNVDNVMNYLLGFFNGVEQLYANENVKLQVSQVLVWTVQDPEAGFTTAGTTLQPFAQRMGGTNYVGDFAAYISTRPIGGGVAYINKNACTVSKSSRSSVSGINTTYLNVPTYSWTVEVVTHEIGHNLGSGHTHWCGWPEGPIDGCGPSATPPYFDGNCAPGPLPTTTGGTIMSYCHLVNVGINFNNGFGPYPGDTIRAFVANSNCLGNCRMTVSIATTNASCGSENGKAVITATNATGAVTATWSNGQTGLNISNFTPGTYWVVVKDAAGCQITEDVVIGNDGPNLTFSLTPSGTANYCAGTAPVLTATSDPAFTYQWFKNTNAVPGATSPTFTATGPGTYSVQVTSPACSGTRSVVLTQVANPTVAATPAVATINKFDQHLITMTGADNFNWEQQPDIVSYTGRFGYVRPLSSTVYTITGTDANGCRGTTTATVNVIGCGYATDFKVTHHSPSQVQVEWMNPEGATTDTLRYRVKGATEWTRVYVEGSSYKLNGLLPNTEYEYSVVALCASTTSFVASETSSFTTLALDNTGLYIRLYPNPVRTQARLELITARPYTLQVNLYDNAGKLVRQLSQTENLPAGQTIKMIDPGVMANGVYYLQVLVDGKVYPVKMVIVH